MPQRSAWVRSIGIGTNEMMQRPSGMPAQTACQVVPMTVAARAMSVAIRTSTPFGPQHVDQEEAGQERAEDAADHPPGVDLPIAPPVRLVR